MRCRDRMSRVSGKICSNVLRICVKALVRGLGCVTGFRMGSNGEYGGSCGITRSLAQEINISEKYFIFMRVCSLCRLTSILKTGTRGLQIKGFWYFSALVQLEFFTVFFKHGQVSKWNPGQLDYKNMKVIRPGCYGFAKSYDLITVGPYANRVAKAVASYGNDLKILTIEEDNYIMEPSLVVNGSPYITLEQKNSAFSDIEMGVGIKKIDPEKSSIRLKNGTKYFYKNLIYSGNPSDWKGPTASTPITQAQSSFIQNDLSYENLDQLFARRGGSIVFTVPKGVHFGCENYFMMFLQDRIRRNRRTAPFETDPLKITVLCEGSSLVPFNQAYNTLIENYLNISGIELIKNVKYQVNPSKRQIQIQGTQKHLNFDSLFQYLPLKPPEILTQAGIDPFQVNRHFLNHSRYENVSIIANVVHNVYSLAAVLEMSRVVCQNVMYGFAGVKRRAIYQGQSKVELWVNQRECHRIETDYNGTRLRRDLGSFRMAREMAGLYSKRYQRNTVQRTINQDYNVFSPWNQPETVSTERHQVPALLVQP